MTWELELNPDLPAKPVIADMLVARNAWKRLSKPARAAVAHGYRHGLVDAHVNTLAALERHGFMHTDCRLTDAGKAVAKWCVKP